MSRQALLCWSLLLSGCAWDEGTGFASIDSATVAARFEPEPARTLDRGVLTDLGYVVEPRELRIMVDSVELESLSSSSSAGGGVSFDPAKPPPGYSLCHGGHCHADDGRLVAYAEIEAEVAGGEGFVPVVSLTLEQEFDLLAGGLAQATAIEPSRELPEARIRRVAAAITRAQLRIAVSGGALSDEVLELDASVDATLRPNLAVDLEIDRDGPATLAVAVELIHTARLFDGIDFQLLGSGKLVLSDLDEPVLQQLSSNLAAGEIVASFRDER